MSLRMKIGAKLTGRKYIKSHRRQKSEFGNKVKSKMTFGLAGKGRVREHTRR